MTKKKITTMKNQSEKKIKRTYSMTMLIAIVCMILSVTILAEKKQYEQDDGGICSAITGSDGCKIVQTSDYGKTLGIDNPIYGLIGFAMLAAASAMMLYRNIGAMKFVVIIGSTIAGAVSIWFLYLQEFVLHKYCIFCIIVDILSLVLLGIAAYLTYTTMTGNVTKHK